MLWLGFPAGSINQYFYCDMSRENDNKDVRYMYRESLDFIVFGLNTILINAYYYTINIIIYGYIKVSLTFINWLK